MGGGPKGDQYSAYDGAFHAPTAYSSTQPDHPLNFSKKHPLYDIYLDKQGPEFSQIDDLRQQYVKNFAGKVPDFEITVPKYIPGLIGKVGPLPSNRRLWRHTSTYERNGLFVASNQNFNTRVLFPALWFGMVYGWWGHATYGWYKAKYDDNEEYIGNFYDKLNCRKPPASKIWLRPG